jgi:hypothetical protein
MVLQFWDKVGVLAHELPPRYKKGLGKYFSSLKPLFYSVYFKINSWKQKFKKENLSVMSPTRGESEHINDFYFHFYINVIYLLSIHMFLYFFGGGQ